MFRDGPFAVLRCSDCGLCYVSPRLQGEALAEVYGADYWKSDNPKLRGYADYANEAVLYLKTYLRRMKLVRRWLPLSARVLDIGCAAGYFLRVVAREGHDVLGVEPSAAIAAEAVRELGSERVHIGALETAPPGLGFAPGSFDLVTLWDVIEHVPDPQSMLRQARTLLKPGGRLLLETQNVGSRWARLLGRRWHHYKHEEHLFHFDPVTIARLLDQCGFTVEYSGAAYAGKYVSFGFIAERAARLGRLPGLLFQPMRLLRRCSVYVNPRDELIVVAAPKA
jgi:SAM-dependent methyltransferase